MKAGIAVFTILGFALTIPTSRDALPSFSSFPFTFTYLLHPC